MSKISSQLPNDSLPKVILLDGMGTLFGLKSSVGKIYQQYAFNYGVEADVESLDRAFINSFKSAPPLAFVATEFTTIKEQEFAWWKNVVRTTFFQLDLLENFSNFTEFFDNIYYYFATKDPWYVFPDVIPALNKWQSKGIELGVISNFDTRLDRLLKALELEPFFASITISSVAGFAKPNPKIFATALNKHNFTAHQAWHIGDSFTEDYEGARQAGIKAFFLNRDSSLLKIKNQLPNLSSLG
jgi:putative hydrolase of the HAD superfamily